MFEFVLLLRELSIAKTALKCHPACVAVRVWQVYIYSPNSGPDSWQDVSRQCRQEQWQEAEAQQPVPQQNLIKLFLEVVALFQVIPSCSRHVLLYFVVHVTFLDQ